MLTLKQGLKLSAIIDKLDLKKIISKAHKAEKEIYAFVAEVKGITPQEAEKVDSSVALGFNFIKVQCGLVHHTYCQGREAVV